MKIYYDGVAYYTREKFLSTIRVIEPLIICSISNYYSDKVGYATERYTSELGDFMVFKPEQLTDDEIIMLLSAPHGGYIKVDTGELASMFGFEKQDVLNEVKEIEVKE